MHNRFYPILLYLKQPFNISLLVLAAIANLASWFWLIYQIGPTDELIFLHYNVLFGVDLIGEWTQVLYIPLSGVFIYLLNTAMSWATYGKDRFASGLLLTINLLCQCGLFVGSAILVFLNT